MPHATTRVTTPLTRRDRVAGVCAVARSRFAPGLLAFVLFGSGTVLAADPPAADDPKALAFFESKIRPVLVEHCYQCHSAEAGKSAGGLQLDSRKAIRAGGDRGPAVVPGDPKASLLLTAVSHADPDLKMPPKKARLPDAVDRRPHDVDPRRAPPTRAATRRPPPPARRWTSRPAAGSGPSASPSPTSRRPRRTRPGPGATSTTSSWRSWRRPGLAPSADAEPATLLRRLHFDLVGPAPVAGRRSATSSRASRRRASTRRWRRRSMPCSPRQHFGERWGRHWLDVARFAESSGKEANISFPYAWRYRDYVIDAVNADVPFDRFLTEQIAGDLLPADDDAERARLLIATGFLALGPKNLDEGNAKQFAADLVDEQIDAVTRGGDGQLGGVRPLPRPQVRPVLDGGLLRPGRRLRQHQDLLRHVRVAGQPRRRRPAGPAARRRPADPARVHHAGAGRQAEGRPRGAQGGEAEDPDATRCGSSGGPAASRGSWTRWTSRARPCRWRWACWTATKIVDAPLLERGEVGRPGKPVPRGFPRVVAIAGRGRDPVRPQRAARAGPLADAPGPPADGPRDGQPRLAAPVRRRPRAHGRQLRVQRRAAEPSGTARPPGGAVRGRRLVGEEARPRDRPVADVPAGVDLSTRPPSAPTRTTGCCGGPPSAGSTPRPSATPCSSPSGELDAARPAGSLVATADRRPADLADRPGHAACPADLDGSRHRSVYLPVLRDRLPDVLDLFDFAEPSLVTGDRETTNVPVQALYLMNSPFVQARAEGAGRPADARGRRRRRARPPRVPAVLRPRPGRRRGEAGRRVPGARAGARG